jgi:hypothetical protein
VNRIASSFLCFVCFASGAAADNEFDSKVNTVVQFCSRLRSDFNPTHIASYPIDAQANLPAPNAAPDVQWYFDGESILSLSTNEADAVNDLYFFSVIRENEESKWQLKELQQRQPGSVAPTKLLLARANRFPFLKINHVPIDTLLQHPESSITSWDLEGGIERATIAIRDSSAKFDERRALTFDKVVVSFEPDRTGWIPVAFEGHTSDGRVLAGSNEEAVPILNFSVPTKLVRFTRNADGSVPDLRTSKYSYGADPVDDAIFRVSHFGIPEPRFGKPSSRFTLIVVALLVIGAILLLIRVVVNRNRD